MMKTTRLAVALSVAVSLAVALTPAQTPECVATKFAFAKKGEYVVLPAPPEGQRIVVCAGSFNVGSSTDVTLPWIGHLIKATTGRDIPIPPGVIASGQGVTLVTSTAARVIGTVSTRVTGAPLPPPPPSIDPNGDEDGDKVKNQFDLCPLDHGRGTDTGCPLPDRDKDGIADAFDSCPDEFAPGTPLGCLVGPPPPPTPTAVDCEVSAFGPWQSVVDNPKLDERRRIVTRDPSHGGAVCPVLVESRPHVPTPPPPPPPPPPPADADKDGVADGDDKCINESGPASNKGCPIALPGSSPMARNEHPRIWVTSDNLPRLRSRVSTGGNLNADMVWFAATLDGNLDNEYLKRHLIYPSYALAYLLLKDGPLPGVPFRRSALDYGRAAQSRVMDFVGLVGANVELAAMLDWLWPLYTPEERTKFALYIKSFDEKLDAGGVWVSQHAEIRAAKLIGAIAMHGSGLADAWSVERLASYRAWFRDLPGIMRAESDLGGGVDAGCGQSSSYCDNTLKFVMFAEEAYRTAFNIPEAVHYGGADANFIRLQAEYDLHHLMPNADLTSATRGGLPFAPWVVERGRYGSQGNITGPFAGGGGPYLSIAGIYETIEPKVSALAQWMIANVTGMPGLHASSLTDDYWWYHRLIRGPDGTLATPPAALGQPLHVVSPEMGRVLWSSAHLAPNDIQVVFDAERWTLQDQHVRPGSFKVFFQGIAITDAGGGISAHAQVGCNGAMAGNILIFPAPEANDCGGARGGGNRSGSDNFIPGGLYDNRDALDVVDTPTYGYIFADITRAYGNTRTPGLDSRTVVRVSHVTRQLVYLKQRAPGDPIFLIVVDRATRVGPESDQRWLIHPVSAVQPSPGAGPMDMPLTPAPVIAADGTITTSNTAFGANNQVFITPILPATRAVKLWEGYVTPYEGGIVTPAIATYPQILPFIGRWTVDIRPTSTALSQVFLHVIEVTTPGRAKTSITYLGGESVQIGSTVVTFAAKTAVVK